MDPLAWLREATAPPPLVPLPVPPLATKATAAAAAVAVALDVAATEGSDRESDSGTFDDDDDDAHGGSSLADEASDEEEDGASDENEGLPAALASSGPAYDAEADAARRSEHTERFRLALEAIIARYDQPFEDDGDEVDIHTLEVVEDRGFLRSLFGGGSQGDTGTPRGAPRLVGPRADHEEDGLWVDSCTPDEEYRLLAARVRRRPRSPAPSTPRANTPAPASSPSAKTARREADPTSTPPPRTPVATTDKALLSSPCAGPPDGCRRLFCLACGGAYS
jgi:hypothetical protein